MNGTVTRRDARLPKAREVRAFAAQCNVENQFDLMETLVAAAGASDATVEDVAKRLGADPAMIEAMLSGDRDTNLNELRLLASALGVVVDYRVLPASLEWHRREQDRLAARASRVLPHGTYQLASPSSIRAVLQFGGDDALHV